MDLAHFDTLQLICLFAKPSALVFYQREHHCIRRQSKLASLFRIPKELLDWADGVLSVYSDLVYLTVGTILPMDFVRNSRFYVFYK